MLGNHAHGTAREGAKIRAATVGMLSRLRADVTREVQKNHRLPRDLDARIFGGFDRIGLGEGKEPRPRGPA